MANAEIESSITTAIDQGKIKGAILCATDRNGNFVYEKALGERDLLSGEKQAHQLDDVLFLASATKLMTTIVALQCVEDGLISLKGDISSIIPELAAQKVLTGFSEDGETPLVEPRAGPITLEMLLTHSSGTPYEFLDPLIVRWISKFSEVANRPDGAGKPSLEEALARPLRFQPGSAWMYGNGIDWAGRIVERVTGKTLGERMHERLFRPLGISDAQFYPVTREDLRKRLVDLNPDDPEALALRVVRGSRKLNQSNKGDFGGQGLFMTAPDYLKVLHSLLANDGKILSRKTVNSMFEQHLTSAAAESFRAALESPNGAFFRVGVAPGSKAGYGLGGLLTLEDVEGWYGERTLTWAGSMTITWFVDRKNDLCGFGAILTPVEQDVALSDELKQTFRRDIYRKRAKSKR